MSTTPERWALLDGLLERALELPDGERRPFLERATAGDMSLLRDALALLASMPRAEAAIAESAVEFVAPPASLTDDDALPTGARLGAYRILGELGRGGMGTVYLAERADREFDRQVAIKRISWVGASRSTTRRFREERRILASLEHPNIARLYDSGADDDGRPYLVLEYVDGTRIDRYADAQRLDLRARVSLVLAVCDAVSFAHQRLVVHRDLKPGNVLVSDRGEVKLLDFGIAKLLDADATDEPLTQRGLRPFTPEYAAPEQVRGEPTGTATDVYALGVLLHELLTGARPAWQQRVLQQAEVRELESLLVPPSRSVTAAGTTEERDRQRSAAAARTLDPARLATTLRGDLDTIVLTALAPEESRRYASVQSLSADLRAWLGGRPIAARPPSAGYRFGKFVRRHRALVSLGATSSLLAIGIVISVFVQSQRVAAERDRAERERTRAEQVATFVTGLFDAADPFAETDPDTLRVRDLLAAGVARLEDDLATQPALRASLQSVVGSVFLNLGRTDGARPLLERAVAYWRGEDSAAVRRAASARDAADRTTALADALMRLGQLRRDESRLDDAEQIFREAIAGYERVGATAAQHIPGALADLARVFNERSRFDSAATYYDRALAALRALPAPDSATLVKILNDRGFLASRTGDVETSLAMTDEALSVHRRFRGADHPTTLVITGNKAFALDMLGRSAEAVPLHREVVSRLRGRLGDGHPMVSGALRNLSASLSQSGAANEAVVPAEEAVAIERRRDGGRHLALAIALDNLAGTYEDARRYDEALPVLVEANALQRSLLPADAPERAISLARLAGARCRAGSPRERQLAGLRDFREALGTLDRVFPADHPQRLSRHVWQAVCMAQLGETAAATRELEAQFESARLRHPPDAPIVRITLRELARHYDRIGAAAAKARVLQLADSLGIPAPGS